MKKFIFLIVGLAAVNTALRAQRYAVVDMQYILSKLPEYAKVDTALKLMTVKWQNEIDSAKQSADSLSRRFDAEKYMLADELKTKRQMQVSNANKYVGYLQAKYFGYEGEMFKQREKLVRPIQNEIYNTLQQMGLKNGWDMVLDKSAGTGLLYSDPKLDKSDLVLQALGVITK
jgi:outer membrane protein